MKFILTLIFLAIIAVGCGGSGGEKAIVSEEPPESQRPIDVGDSSLDIIMVDNASKYPVSGNCDFDSKNPVVVSIAGVATPIHLDCQSDHTFSGFMDMSLVTSAPAVVTISQATSSTLLEIRNELVPLRVLALEELQSFVELEELQSFVEGVRMHRLTGMCDGSEIAGSVPEVVVEMSSMGVNESVPCTPEVRNSTVASGSCGTSPTCGRFSFDFPMGTRNPRALALRLTQGSWKANHAYSLATPVEPLALDTLKVLNLSSAGAYGLSGKCDASLEGQSLRIHIQESGGDNIARVVPKQVLCVKSGESANTFSTSFNLVNLTEPSIVFHVSYGREDVSSPLLANNIVPLSFAGLAAITTRNISNYPVEGACDSSLLGQRIRVSVSHSEVSQEVSCDSTPGVGFNTFSAPFDLRGISEPRVIFYARYGGQSVESSAVPNSIVNLSLDSWTLVSITSDNARLYTLSGNCDPSLFSEKIQVIMGVPNIMERTDCLSKGTFSVTMDVSGIVSKPATVTVTYGDQEQMATVGNELIHLGFTGPLGPLTSANQSAYTLAGVCNSAIAAQVILTVTETRASRSTDCTNNAFSINIDASNTNTNPVPMLLSHGSQNLNINVPSNIVLLTANLPTLFNMASAESYTLTGRCDSTVAGQVQVTLVDANSSSNNMGGTSACTMWSYSVTLDGRGIMSDPVFIQVVHGNQRAEAQVVNNIVRLSLNPLPSAFNLATALAYRISGACDFSVAGEVAITLLGTGAEDNLLRTTVSCNSDNTFSVTLDASVVTVSSFMVQASHGAEMQTSAPVPNNIVRLSLTQPTEPFNASTAGHYGIEGECDASLSISEYVIVSVEGSTVQESVTCQSSNTFSVDLNASSLAIGTPFVVTATYGGEADQTEPIANDIVALGFNTLVPLNGATASNYSISGDCDVSLASGARRVTVTMGTPHVTETLDCGADNRFVVFVDASIVTSKPNATITAVYGADSVTQEVLNELILLGLGDGVSPPPVNAANESSYTVTGICDASITGPVELTVDDSGERGSGPCRSGNGDHTDNTFSISVDASGVNTNLIPMTLTHGTQEVRIVVENARVSLDIKQTALLPFNLFNSANYTVTGDCEASLGEGVVVRLIDVGDPSHNTTDTATCVDNTYSATLNGQAITSSSVLVQATHGVQESSFTLSNLIVRLAFDPLPSTFNLATALAYSISGACDISLGEVVAISLVGTSVDGSPLGATALCVSGNTFSVTFDASAARASSFMVQVSYGAEVQTSASVSNTIVHLSLAQPMELFNASTVSAYPFSGQCDSSLIDGAPVLISLQGTDISVPLNCLGNSFDGTLDVSAVKDLTSYPSTLVFEASYGGKISTAQPVANDYILLSFNALGPLNSVTALLYEVSGKCDASLGELVTVTVVEVSITADVSCLGDNTFTRSFNLSAWDSSVHRMITIQGEHDGQTQSQSISNDIVTLAFAGTQDPLSNGNSDNYTISGFCDHSLGDVTIQVESPTVTKMVPCAPTTHTFTIDMDLTDITSGLMQIRLTQVGSTEVIQSVDNNTISNDATLSALSFSDEVELNPNFDSGILSYEANTILGSLTITATLNHERASLVSTPVGTQSGKVATIPIPLDSLGEHDLTLTVTAEDGVTQNIYRVTVVRVPQSFQLDTSLEALTDGNKNSYTVTGTCNFFVLENVVVVMGDPATDPQAVLCQADGSFSASIDAGGIVTHPVTIRATHGEETFSGRVDNETVGPLYFLALPPLTTDLVYQLRGVCDAVAGDVTVVIGEPNVEAIITCAGDGTFSGTLGVQGVSANPATVSLSQGGDSIETRVGNDIQRFVTVWDFPANYEFIIPLDNNYNYNFTVDWGDGSTISEVSSFSDPDKTHIYTLAGEYTVIVKGLFEAFKNYGAETKDKLLSVPSLGNMGWKSFERSFRGNTNLTTVLGGNTSRVTDMNSMFYGATSAIPDTSVWNTSRVTDMNSMFYNATLANPDTSNWDTSKVVDMDSMFYGTAAAIPNTSSWNTSKVKGMNSMFYNAALASPDTSSWDTSKVTDMYSMFEGAPVAIPNTGGWDTSKVTDMGYMFDSATLANPDTSSWNTSKVADMESMFAEATSANPNTSAWDTSKVTDMESMFYGATSANPDTSSWDFARVVRIADVFSNTGLSVDHYSKLLISLHARPPTRMLANRKSIDVAPLRYNSTATAARASLVVDGWIFTDGGLETK